ncbi:type VI secretion system protein TssA [Aquabacterium sp. A7-Y]|uniref:type VI secretion system protein TssA n=1 Tax=Aquabacterium sp. A7-Y TaxID=1349605 RepID=UPI00223CD80F|nr:type VI secretion system protein TssA [Aquabacterium sp. A7-Y]MCW7539706.1 type VI secretion system protein TssA [Aquabacterium sp. A7-Y]
MTEGWWMPLEGSEPGGPNLEYDADFITLMAAAAGKPESLFGPAQPPDWLEVHTLAETLMPRTRDLRVAVMWGRAAVALRGIDELPATLRLLAGLLETCWDHLHPQPDPEDVDAFVRLGQFTDLDTAKGLLGDLRHAILTNDRRLPSLRLRDIEVALDHLPARESDEPLTSEQIRRAFAELPEVAQHLAQRVAEAEGALNALRDVMTRRFGAAQPVQFKGLRQMLALLRSLLPPPVTAAGVQVPAPDEASPVAPTPRPMTTESSPHALSIETRADALRALRQVRAFLERTEPTNPAQLMLRRAERVIDKDFFELVREIAPGGLADAARILGVDTESSADTPYSS